LAAMVGAVVGLDLVLLKMCREDIEILVMDDRETPRKFSYQRDRL